MRGVDHLHKSGRELAQGQILGARQRSPPFYQKLHQHSGFVENVSGEYFGRLIATGEWCVCLLFSCKVRYPQNKNIFFKSLKVKVLSLDIKYMMFFGVTVQEID